MKYLSKDGLEYLWGKIKTALDGKRDKVIDTRTYTGYYNNGANEANSRNVFFCKVKRKSYYEPWRLKCRIIAETPSYPNSGIYTNWEIDYYGYQSNVKAQYVKVNHGSYCALTSMLTLYPVSASNNECYFGFTCASSSSNHYNSASYARTVVVDLLEYENCEIEMLDNLLWWKDMTQANYTSRDVGLTTSGYQETGDANTAPYFEARLYNTFTAETALHAYGLCGLNADKTGVVGIAGGTSGTGTAKTPQTTHGIRPEHLYYRYGSSAVAAGTSISGDTLYYQQNFDVRYSMNWSTATKFPIYTNLYLVGTMGADGLFYVADVEQWIVSERTDTTKAYMQFGRVYNANGYSTSLYEDVVVWVYDTSKSAWVQWANTIGIPEEISADDISGIVDDLEEETPTNQLNYISKRRLLSFWSGIKNLFNRSKIVVVDCGTISSLPKTVSNSAISSDHVCVKAELSSPIAQSGDWTVTTSNGSLTITGSLYSGHTTTLKLYLGLKGD